MKTKRKRAAVMSAPRDAGDSIPSIANTAKTSHRIISNTVPADLG